MSKCTYISNKSMYKNIDSKLSKFFAMADRSLKLFQASWVFATVIIISSELTENSLKNISC
jgi:hypothetical protein